MHSPSPVTSGTLRANLVDLDARQIVAADVDASEERDMDHRNPQRAQMAEWAPASEPPAT